MKRSLPTVHTGGQPHSRAARRPVAPRERADAPAPLLTIGWANHAREAAQLALRLCAALTKQGVAVAVLLASEGAEPLPNGSIGQFLEAGARAAKWVNLPAQGADKLLAGALAELAGSQLVLALGNAPAEFYRPFFSVVVSGHRRQRIIDDAQILQADLEVTSPSDGLADELARMLAGRLTSS
ncbi:MAG TPA: hypothetical protein VJV78_15450 [Polyangiales bacterium]|nr:hypothetical protein [Polyangiales bacterium]